MGFVEQFFGGSMFTRVMIAASVALAGLTLAQPAAAQYRVHYGFYRGAPPTDPSISVYGGYMDMGHYVNGPLGTSASGADAGLLGAQVTLPLTPNFAVVGNLAHANSSLVFFVPAGGGPSIDNSEVWLFDGDLQFSAPFRGSSGHWVNPFLQLGAGAMRYSTQNTAGSAEATNFAFNIGGGLDYYVSHSVGLRVLAKDYIGHWNTPGFGYRYDGRYTDNFSISAGLVLGLGR
jgi:opacity protein-like surface antigen